MTNLDPFNYILSNIFNLFFNRRLLVHFFYFKIESTNTKYSAVKEKNKKTMMTDNCRMTSLIVFLDPYSFHFHTLLMGFREADELELFLLR